MADVASHAAAFDAIRQKFNTEWTALRPNVPIAWDNVNFTPSTEQSYVNLFIQPANVAQVSVGDTGSRRYRHRGLVVIAIFTPTGEGPDVAENLVTDAASIFIGTTDSGIVFNTAEPSRAGKDGSFYRYNVRVEYRWDTLL